MLQTYVDAVVSGGSHVGDSASVSRRQHDLVSDERVLEHHAVDVSSCDVAADLTAAGKKKKLTYNSSNTLTVDLEVRMQNAHIPAGSCWEKIPMRGLG